MSGAEPRPQSQFRMWNRLLRSDPDKTTGASKTQWRQDPGKFYVPTRRKRSIAFCDTIKTTPSWIKQGSQPANHRISHYIACAPSGRSRASLFTGPSVIQWLPTIILTSLLSTFVSWCLRGLAPCSRAISLRLCAYAVGKGNCITTSFISAGPALNRI